MDPMRARVGDDLLRSIAQNVYEVSMNAARTWRAPGEYRGVHLLRYRKIAPAHYRRL
jgi:hypothetical protein